MSSLPLWAYKFPDQCSKVACTGVSTAAGINLGGVSPSRSPAIFTVIGSKPGGDAEWANAERMKTGLTPPANSPATQREPLSVSNTPWSLKIPH
ncbi:MAG TPA: hypothetical protein VFB55_11185 [Verrucomicrobiae bacterium]|nr:hypothetical protein [Verrucomicrobiae bacterium]